MAQERFKLMSGASLILEKDKKILLIRRFNTGYDDGKYSLVGGGVDGNETIRQATVREAHEEVGILIKPDDLEILHVQHIFFDKNESLGFHSPIELLLFYLKPKIWTGEPKNCESNRCDDIGWFSTNKLPENIVPYTKYALKNIKKNVLYSEWGWK